MKKLRDHLVAAMRAKPMRAGYVLVLMVVVAAALYQAELLGEPIGKALYYITH